MASHLADADLKSENFFQRTFCSSEWFLASCIIDTDFSSYKWPSAEIAPDFKVVDVDNELVKT